MIPIIFNVYKRRCNPCSEHTSLRSVIAVRFMASEREWLPQTAEKYSREDARREEQDSPTDPGSAAVIESLLYIKGKPPEKTDDLVIFSEVCCML